MQDYFLHFQDPTTGYFIDKTLDDGEYVSTVNENDKWWGYGHLLCQVLPCLMILGVKPVYPLVFLENTCHGESIRHLLSSLKFGERIAYDGNVIMNYGVALQYDAYIVGRGASGVALSVLLDFLKCSCNSLGVWGRLEDSPYNISQKVQGAFHIWPLFFYSKAMPVYGVGLVDYVLSTQNFLGGYGLRPYRSSACEDIDSIEPLRRFYDFVDGNIKNRIQKSVLRSLPWIMANKNTDGGFVFALNEELHYGHDRLYSMKNESALFPTWFRVLSLAHIMRVLGQEDEFYFCGCPGFMF